MRIADGTGIPTSSIAECYKAGYSLPDLAEDYDCNLSQIEDAICCEIPLAAWVRRYLRTSSSLGTAAFCHRKPLEEAPP